MDNEQAETNIKAVEDRANRILAEAPRRAGEDHLRQLLAEVIPSWWEFMIVEAINEPPRAVITTIGSPDR